jgi:centromere protein I
MYAPSESRLCEFPSHRAYLPFPLCSPARTNSARSLALSRQTGHDSALIGLLRVYKDYYPEIIVGNAVRGKAAVFKV